MRIGLQPGMVEWLDPAAPDKLSSLFLQEGWGGVLSLQVVGTDAFVALAPTEDAFREIEVSDPSAPVVQRDFESPWDPMEMSICEDRLYMSSADGLWIYDLAEPALPGLLAGYPEWQDFNALPLPDDTLYDASELDVSILDVVMAGMLVAHVRVGRRRKGPD